MSPLGQAVAANSGPMCPGTHTFPAAFNPKNQGAIHGVRRQARSGAPVRCVSQRRPFRASGSPAASARAGCPPLRSARSASQCVSPCVSAPQRRVLALLRDPSRREAQGVQVDVGPARVERPQALHGLGAVEPALPEAAGAASSRLDLLAMASFRRVMYHATGPRARSLAIRSVFPQFTVCVPARFVPREGTFRDPRRGASPDSGEAWESARLDPQLQLPGPPRRIGHQPAPRHLLVRIPQRVPRTVLEHDVAVVRHHRVAVHPHGEGAGQGEQPLLDPAPCASGRGR